LWSTKQGNGRTGSGGELTAELSQIAPGIKEAEIILTPNPTPVEPFAFVDRIWGREVVFSHVPLIRQDVPGGVSVQTKSPAVAPGAEVETFSGTPRIMIAPKRSWAVVVLLIVGGLFLCALVAIVVLLVIWIRKAKPGPGKSVAIGCGVAFLVGLVFVLLSVGLTFAWWSQTRTNLRREMEANQQRAKEEMVRRHQQQQIERKETTNVRSIRH
jgi:membrane protein implicated in regulation of membrane protease activity